MQAATSVADVGQINLSRGRTFFLGMFEGDRNILVARCCHFEHVRGIQICEVEEKKFNRFPFSSWGKKKKKKKEIQRKKK